MLTQSKQCRFIEVRVVLKTQIRTYSELIQIPTFEERFEYLKLMGQVGNETFGFDRYLNQQFYRSKEWKDLRNHIFVRDNGCDLGVEGRDIYGRFLIHHMNPISIEDITDSTEYLLNPEFLITVTSNTHNAIHYGDKSLLTTEPVVRSKNDTCPWR